MIVANVWAGAWHALIALMLAGCVLGCRRDGLPNMVRLRGSVSYNGLPLTEGTVLYLPKDPAGRQARGEIQPDGTFALTTLRDADGAQQGEYSVVVIALEPHPGEPTREEIEASGGLIQRGYAIPERYTRAESSGLTDVVDDKHPGFREFQLEGP